MEKPLLQCSRCQVKFANHDLLKSHEKNVDCPVVCPGCGAGFPNKATRLQHQQDIHNNENKESQFFEIDDAMDKKIKAKLKAYTESLRKGKMNSDPKLEKWIDDNTERYMIGRDSTAKPRLELGQWYIIFTTLTSSDVLGHPCMKPFLLILSLANISSLRLRQDESLRPCRGEDLAHS
jgi:hypothetical protein